MPSVKKHTKVRLKLTLIRFYSRNDHPSAHAKAQADRISAHPPSSAATVAELPVEQTKYPIYNCRLWKLRGTPIAIYHSMLAKFKDDLKNPDIMPSSDKLSFTHQLLVIASESYPNEAERVKSMTPILASLLGSAISPFRNEDGISANGSVVVENKRFLLNVQILLWELRNEVGVGGCDPSIQGGFIARKSRTQNQVSRI